MLVFPWKRWRSEAWGEWFAQESLKLSASYTNNLSGYWPLIPFFLFHLVSASTIWIDSELAGTVPSVVMQLLFLHSGIQFLLASDLIFLQPLLLLVLLLLWVLQLFQIRLQIFCSLSSFMKWFVSIFSPNLGWENCTKMENRAENWPVSRFRNKKRRNSFII